MSAAAWGMRRFGRWIYPTDRWLQYADAQGRKQLRHYRRCPTRLAPGALVKRVRR